MDWREVRPLLERVLALPEDEREIALAAECGADAELLSRLRALLAAGREKRELFEPLAQQELSPASPGAGERVGAWRLVELLGEGGMGRVWLAERADSDFRQRAALKLVKLGMDTEAVLRRFRRERQVLADLDHPGIVRLLDGGVSESGRPYMVMELVAGTPLDAYCRERELALEARLELLARVCEAVDAAHELGIVHRGLKPANVLITAEGEPKVLDFGIAKTLADDGPEASLLTRTGERLLTPRYAAPEQVRGEACTPATDVYALGVMLYELLSDRAPYALDGATPKEIESAVCEEEPRRPSVWARGTQRRRLAGDLDVIALRSLAKDPARRYRDAGRFALDLRRHLAHRPIEARPDSIRYRVAKFVRRNRTLIVSVLGILVVLLAALGIITGLWRRSIRVEAETRATAYGAHLQSAETSIRDGGTAVARAQLEAAPAELRGWEWRHLWKRLDRSRRTFDVAVKMGSAEFLTHSPDGSLLAIAVGRTVELLDARSGAKHGQTILGDILLPGWLPSLASQVDFHPNGGELAVAHCDKRVRVFSVEDLTLRHELEVDAAGCTGLAYDPTGNWLACACGSGRIALFRLPEHERVAEIQGHEVGPAVTLAFQPQGRYLASRGWDKSLRLWNVPDLTLAHDLTGRETNVADISNVEFLPDGERLVSASMDGTLRVWRVEDGRMELVFRGHHAPVYCVAVDPVEGWVVSGDEFGNLLRWDPASGQELARLLGHSEPIRGIEFSPDGARLVSADAGHCLKVWNRDAADVWTRRVSEYPRNLLPDLPGAELGVVEVGGRLRRWSWPALEPRPDLELVDGAITRVVSLARWIDGRGIVFAVREGAVHVAELPRGTIRELASGQGEITAFHTDSRGERALLMTSREEVSGLTLLDLVGDEPPRELRCPRCQEWPRRLWPRLAEAADGRCGLVDGQGHLLFVELRSGAIELACELPLPPEDSFILVLDPDGRRAYVGHASGVLAWDLVRGAPLWNNTAIGSGRSIVIHPVEERLLVGTGSGTIAVLEAESGRTLVRLGGHGGPVEGLAWGADGETLLSTSMEGSLRLWDVE